MSGYSTENQIVNGNLTVRDTLYLSSVTGTNATFTNATIPYLSTTSLTGTTVSVSGLTTLTDVLVTGNMTGTNAYIANLSSTNLASQGATLGFSGLTVVGGTTLIGTLNATGGITTTTFTGTNVSATNATISNASITSLTSSTIATSSLTGGSANITYLSATTFTGTNIYTTTFNATNLSASVFTGTDNYLTNAVISTLTGTNIYGTNAVISTLTGTTIYGTDATIDFLSVASLTGPTIYTTDINAISSSLNIGTTSGTDTINIGTGLGSTTINLGGVGDTVNIAGDLVYVNSTVTEITNPYFIINEGGSNIVNTGLVISRTGPLGATTGAYFLVNSTSDGWVAQAGSGPVIHLDQDVGTGASPSFNTVYLNTLNVTNANITTLTGTTIYTSDLNATGTANLNNVLLSGNMTGSNAYIANLSSVNLASQGATLGFSGLTVVGGTTLIGTLNATGGITTTTFTGTNVNATNGSITNLSSTSISTSSLTASTFTGTTAQITNLTVGNYAFPTTIGANGLVLTSDGTNLIFSTGTSGVPIYGTDTQMLFNAAGQTTGSSNVTYNYTSNELSVSATGIFQTIVPAAADTYDLGSSTKTWRNIYAGTGIMTNALIQSLQTNILAATGAIIAALTGSFISSTGGMQINTSYTPQKFYSMGQASIAANVTPAVKINFGKSSFSANIRAILSEQGDVNNLSTLSLNVMGGTTDGSSPSYNVVTAGITEFHNSLNSKYWSTSITGTAQAIEFAPFVSSPTGYNYSVSIDFLAHTPTANVSSIESNAVTVRTFDY